MIDPEANDVLDLIEIAARKQMARDLDGLERLTDTADRIAARAIAEQSAITERTLAASGVDPLSSEKP